MKLYLALALGGLPLGAMYALQAMGIVIVYKTSRYKYKKARPPLSIETKND